MRIYNRKKQVRIQDEAFKDKTRYMYRYKYKNSIKLYFCNNYVRKITGKSYGFFSEIIIYYELWWRGYSSGTNYQYSPEKGENAKNAKKLL